MTQSRRRRSQGGTIDAKDIFRTLEANSYGGTKDGKRTRSELPQSPKSDEVKGIKVKFDKASDKYPAVVELLMTDNKWVEYRIHIEQPAFTAVMESLKEGNWETGYPPKRS